MHTKGPWSADLTAILNAARGIQAHYQGEAWKDRLDEWNNITTANARLIAAAPELLDELIVSIERGIKLGYSCEGQLELYKNITNEEYVEEYIRRKAKGE